MSLRWIRRKMVACLGCLPSHSIILCAWVLIHPSHACSHIPTHVLSCIQLFATSWTIAHQALLSMGFSRQEYWGGLPLPGWHTHSALNCSHLCLTWLWDVKGEPWVCNTINIFSPRDAYAAIQTFSLLCLLISSGSCSLTVWVCLPAGLFGKLSGLRSFCLLPRCQEIIELALFACLGNVCADLTPQSPGHSRACLSQRSKAPVDQCGDTQSSGLAACCPWAGGEAIALG